MFNLFFCFFVFCFLFSCSTEVTHSSHSSHLTSSLALSISPSTTPLLPSFSPSLHLPPLPPSLLLLKRRGSLYQRQPCPTFTQKIYDDLLQVKTDEVKKPTSAMEAKQRAEMQSISSLDYQRHSMLIGSNMIQPIELIKSLTPNGIIETWARRGRKESLVVETYKEVRAQVMEIIKKFHKLGGTNKRDRYSEMTRMSTIPIISLGVIRISTPIEFDDRVIPMHSEYHRKGKRNKSSMHDLEGYIDQYWDMDSTDPEDEDSGDDVEPPIEGRM